MPKFFNMGIATSWRHVVGLQDPPRKTSYFGMPSERDGHFSLKIIAENT
jgi:hypothetical protein